MEPLIRRMAIIVLLSVIFAFTFAAIVQSKQGQVYRVHPGTNAPCLHPASIYCVSVP